MQLLNSIILGEGKPLLILHGFLGMLDNWKTLGNKYAENGFQVHLIDQRNHGKSFWSDDFNYSLLTKDLKQYIDHHNLTNVNIIGHSMGGKTAMMFAATYPQLVSKLLVADIGPKLYPLHHQTILEGLQAIDFNTLNSRKEADDILSNYVKDIGTRLFLLKNLYRKDKNNFGFKCNLPALVNNIEEIGKPLPEAHQYNGDVLFLRGGKSNYILEEDKPLIMHHFLNAKIDTIPNTGHWLHAEDPEDFLQKSLVFFNL